MFAFFAVPWIPIFILPIYSAAVSSSDLNPSQLVHAVVGSSAILAAFTYLIELVVIYPLWRLFLRKKMTSLPGFVVTGFVVAFFYSAAVAFTLFGFEFFGRFPTARLIFLFAFIGGAEAALFWFIVRPDRYKPKAGAA